MKENLSRGSARAAKKRKSIFVLRRGDKKKLAELMRGGRGSVRVIKRARVLQLLNEGETESVAAKAAGYAVSTVGYIKRRYRFGGLEKALWDAPRGKPEEALNGKQKQRVVAMLCGPSPTGRARWTIRLAAYETRARKIAPKIGRETIRVLMHNHDLKPWREKNVVRPEADVGIRRKDGERSRGIRETG